MYRRLKPATTEKAIMDEIRKLNIEEVNQRFLFFINRLDILSKIGILPERYRAAKLLEEYKDVSRLDSKP